MSFPSLGSRPVRGKNNGRDSSAFFRSLRNVASAAAMLTALGFSAFAQTMILPNSAAAMLTALGFSAFAQTMILPNSAAAFQKAMGAREVLTANRTYNVGAAIPTPTFSIATPCVVTSTAHGLQAGDPIVPSVQRTQITATVTAANPAVITATNTYAAGQPVVFASTGLLPPGIVAGTTYYVSSASLSGSSFQVADTAAHAIAGTNSISTAALTATFTNGSANIVVTGSSPVVGQLVRFATTGTLPTNFATATDYYVVTGGTTITVSATNGGSAIVAGSAGSGTQTLVQTGTHYVAMTGALPTGLTEGTAVYVSSAGLTTNSFQVADTAAHAIAGTNSIATSGTQSGLFSAYTGNNANDGQGASRGHALLTMQQAATLIGALDGSVYNVTIQLADGTYTENLLLSGPLLGSGNYAIQGNTSALGNVQWACTANRNLQLYNGTKLSISGVTISNTSNNVLCFVQDFGSVLTIGAGMAFGACGTTGIKMWAYNGGIFLGRSSYIDFGSAYDHWLAGQQGSIDIQGITVTQLGVPAYSIFATPSNGGLIFCGSNTYVGSATGQKYLVQSSGAGLATGGSTLPGNTAGSVTSPGWVN